MPSSILGDHAYTTQGSDRPREMSTLEAAPARHAIRKPAIYPTDADAILPEKPAKAPKLDKRSREYVLKSGLAGGIAGCAAKTIVGPLDRVKILFQASNPQFAKYTGSWFGVATAIRDIWNQDGSRGLFRGHSATLLRIFPYAGIKFLAYEQIRHIIIRDKSQETALRRLTSGSLAGLVSVFFTYPLEVIRVRLAFETKRDSRSSLTGICKKIYNEQAPIGKASAPHLNMSSPSQIASSTLTATAATIQHVTPRSGLSNFYRGFTPTMVGMFPYAGFSFLTHDAMGDLMRHPRIEKYTTLPHTKGTSRDPDKPPQLKHWAELTTGGIAGFVSQTLSYPLEVIRRRMQVGGVVGDGHRLGMAEVAKKIYMERGWRGFFVGLAIGYVKVVPMVATSFFVYERAKYYLGI